jgi:hypothetical protein
LRVTVYQFNVAPRAPKKRPIRGQSAQSLSRRVAEPDPAEVIEARTEVARMLGVLPLGQRQALGDSYRKMPNDGRCGITVNAEADH